MKEVSREEILAVTEHLTELSYIDGEPLTLTEKADEFIKARRTLLMKRPKAATAESVAVPVKKAASGEEDSALMERLRELRKKIAATLGVPAYVIFADATLRDMSIKKPLTTAEFMQVSGIGSIKAERFGKQFAEVIQKYIEERR